MNERETPTIPPTGQLFKELAETSTRRPIIVTIPTKWLRIMAIAIAVHAADDLIDMAFKTLRSLKVIT